MLYPCRASPRATQRTSTWQALLEAGHDPTLRHVRWGFRPPYDVASTREARNAFRRHRAAASDAWDWQAAHVPEGMTGEQEAERDEREKAKAKEKKKARAAPAFSPAAAMSKPIFLSGATSAARR